jgi:gliding motility-associated-like protein
MNNSSTYCFYVRALDNNGNISASSNEICFIANVIDLADYTYLNYATVENDFTAELKCFIDTTADIANYVVTRKKIPNGVDDTLGVFVIDTYDEFIRFFDNNAKTQESAYEYKIFIVDACGNLTGETNIGTTIFLEGEPMPGFTNKLSWNKYNLWDAKVASYNLYSCPDFSKQNATLIATFDSTGKYYEHDVETLIPSSGTICYFIEAIEGLGNRYEFRERSYSNVICLEQEPVIYIPNAYVFGGLSETFGPRGIFENMTADFSFSIWNRWGEKIFETSAPGQNWDATYKGRKVPLGVYVYMLDFTSKKGKNINKIGIVTVIE